MRLSLGSNRKNEELVERRAPMRLASEQDAVQLITWLEFEPGDILGWLMENTDRLTPEFSRNIMPYFRETISILEMELPGIRRAIEVLNNPGFGRENYQTRQAWRLLAMASGLQDKSFWDPDLGEHVDSFESGDESYIAFHDRTIVEFFGTRAELDPKFNHVYLPGKITYKVLE